MCLCVDDFVQHLLETIRNGAHEEDVCGNPIQNIMTKGLARVLGFNTAAKC